MPQAAQGTFKVSYVHLKRFSRELYELHELNPIPFYFFQINSFTRLKAALKPSEIVPLFNPSFQL